MEWKFTLVNVVENRMMFNSVEKLEKLQKFIHLLIEHLGQQITLNHLFVVLSIVLYMFCMHSTLRSTPSCTNRIRSRHHQCKFAVRHSYYIPSPSYKHPTFTIFILRRPNSFSCKLLKIVLFKR